MDVQVLLTLLSLSKVSIIDNNEADEETDKKSWVIQDHISPGQMHSSAMALLHPIKHIP